jgi:hypothetical protein
MEARAKPIKHTIKFNLPERGSFDFWEMPSPCQGFEIKTINADRQLSHVFYTIREIQEMVCLLGHVTLNDLISAHRHQNICNARHVAVALCRVFTSRSMPEIGRMFGGKDHSTIHNSITKMKPVVAEIEWSFNAQSLEYIVRSALDVCWRLYPPAKYSRHGARP